jgi:hypothetical protein
MNTLKFYREQSNNYSIIAATNELRYFLFDNPCIGDMFYENTRERIHFYVNSKSFLDNEGEPLFLWKTITPYDDNFIDVLSRDQFIKFTALCYNGKPYKVIDVIKYYAFVRGGIHLQCKNKEYVALKEAFKAIIFDNQLSALDHTMADIIEVATEGIEHYYENVLIKL